MESSADTVESAAAYLFDIFKATQSVGQSEARSLKNTFGPYPASHATKACQAVNKIVSWLPEKVDLCAVGLRRCFLLCVCVELNETVSVFMMSHTLYRF